MRPIYTIGYEGSDIDSFVATLHAVGIEALIDVRAVPISRKRGFSKRTLSERLGAGRVSYLHFGELGDPKSGREAARAGRFDEFRAIYGAHLKHQSTIAAMERLFHLSLVQATCLMCFERDPLTCHRSLVTDSFRKRGLPVIHLRADPSLYEDHAASSSRRGSGEGAPAAQQNVW